MKKLIPLTLIALTLSSCMFRTHKDDVVQGNIISANSVKKLHKGMSMAQVKNVMGTPMLINVFTPNKTTYLYTFQAGYERMKSQSVQITFAGGKVSKINTIPYG